MDVDAGVPVTVIGGYLGAGKTTLVNSLLRQAAGRRLAVLVNDFGDLSIDADLIEGADDQVLQLAGGCVCCTIGSDLVAALAELRERFPDVDQVLLEASGVAMPGAVASTVTLISGLRRAAVVVVVAADRLPGLLADSYLSDTIERQLAAADLLIVGHASDCDASAMVRLRERLTRINARAPVIAADHGRVPIDLVLEPRLNTIANDSRGLAPRPIGPANAPFASLTLTASGPVDADALCQALHAPDLGIERAKGVLFCLDGALRVVHVLGRDCRLERSANPPRSAYGDLVIIGLRERLDEARLLRSLAGFQITGRRYL
ncbi:MAG: GTP-binding protein [Burkholderiaceae bacterium]